MIFTYDEAGFFIERIQELGYNELQSDEKIQLQKMLEALPLQKALGNLYHIMRATMHSTTSLNIHSDKEDAERFLRAQGHVAGLENAVTQIVNYAVIEEDEHSIDEKEEVDG